MELALFLGCTIPSHLEAYERSSRAILDALGIGLVDIQRFNCCGYPLRNTEFPAYLLAAARDMALAETKGLNLLTLCKCCYGSLKQAQHTLKQQPALIEGINGILRKEGLEYTEGTEIKHLLTLLHKDFGLENLRDKVVYPQDGLRTATHYGCHALRPSRITRFDDPICPTLFDELVEVTGATSIQWESRLQCCGAPLLGSNRDLSMQLATKKIQDALQCHADVICDACPYCHLQFEVAQRRIQTELGSGGQVPHILYSQLIGISMGLDERILGSPHHSKRGGGKRLEIPVK